MLATAAALAMSFTATPVRAASASAYGATAHCCRSGGRSRSSAGGRTNYGGGHHSRSHGGSARGGHGSLHKGGQYTSPRTHDHYGRHH